MSTTTEASLPPELWVKIFDNINSFQQLVQCSLVNERWQRYAGIVISSKSLTIEEYRVAAFVYKCLKSNSEIAKCIKHLTMTASVKYPSGYDYDKRPHAYIQDSENDIDNQEYFKKLVPLVVNQHLETFGGSMEGSAFFELLLAQSASEEGLQKFSNLKKIPSAWNYNRAYDRLLYRLRHTLKQVTLCFQFAFAHQNTSQFTTLYHLDMLTQLEDLSFNSENHTIQQLERILKNCNRLKCLRICADTSFKDVVGDVDEWIKSNTVQNSTLTTLKVQLVGQFSPHFMNYLLFKYHHVEKVLVWNMSIFRPWRVALLGRPIEIGVIKSILDSIHGVASYTLECLVARREIDSINKTLTEDGYSAFKGSGSIVVTNNYADHAMARNESCHRTYPRSLSALNNIYM